MKKIICLLILVTYNFNFAQIVLSRHSGEIINNGQVTAFNTIAFPAAEMTFYVTNTSTTSTNVNVSCESLVNNTGTGFELCFGNECLPFVEQGETYPSAPVTLAANGGKNGEFDHFLNTEIGVGPYPKDYTFRFFQVGPNGVVFGNEITCTYRFDPNLSVDDVNQLQTSGVIIKSTLVDTKLELDVLKPTSLMIYDINGKTHYSGKLNYGIQTIDISSLVSGLYFVKFIDAEGRSTSKKIVVK